MASSTKPLIPRDMKPNNLLIGSHGQLKLADFDLARIFGSPDRRFTHQYTLKYTVDSTRHIRLYTVHNTQHTAVSTQYSTHLTLDSRQ
ncbi:hypothetical protein L2E82_17571 [Cichorium intybus]|uniref:Uncharacterized protein n=1 Tax=Cichorium intybus TaxID=13427 RepID=A0ACB9F9I1_CICIN|nr:hypothetical protein L2E82_17571 [Cichorium intybus]